MKTTDNILSVEHTQTELDEHTKRSVDSFHYIIKVLSNTTFDEALAKTEALTDEFMDKTALTMKRETAFGQLTITQLASLVCKKAAISSNQPVSEQPMVTGEFDTTYLTAARLSDAVEPFGETIIEDRSFGALSMIMRQYFSVRGLLQVWFYDTDPKASSIHDMLSNIAELERENKLFDKKQVEGVLDPDLVIKVVNSAIEELFAEKLLDMFSTPRNEGRAANDSANVFSSDTLQ